MSKLTAVTTSALLGFVTLTLGAAEIPRPIDRGAPARPKARSDVLPGLNGLVAVPVLSDADGLPQRLMGVGVDDRGTVFVTETARQGREEISLLQSTFLHEADMALMTVAEKEAWILANFSPRIARSQGIRDFNRDGVVDVKDVTVESEKIFILRDADKDGKFGAATLFAEGFNGITTGVAHSVAPIGNAVYATIIPDLWKLRDTDGDGRADVRERLVHGFANHIGYGNHDLHSVVRGYDGKLYWSMGDRGLNVVSKEGKRWAYPHTGAVVRCNPDGSEFEVFASGLRNLQYFDFDDYGNMFSVDHDADFQGEMERLVFVPQGSDSGWRNYYQYRQVNRVLGDSAKDLYSPWLSELMWKPLHPGQPSHFLPPIENSWNAPASFSFQPGLALGGKYRGHFFLGGVGAIRAFKMVADGASFRREGEDIVVDGLGQQVLASSFAPSGELYFVLWRPPLNRPPLWVLRDANTQGGEVATILAQGVDKRSPDQLAQMLRHEDRRVRAVAQDELAARGGAGVFRRVALDENAPRLARIHGLWGLTQLKRWDEEFVEKLAASSDDEMQAQLARYVGDLGKGPSGEKWATKLLNHQSPRVKLMAAIASGKLRASSATPGLLAMLKEAANTVPVLREAGVIGLMGAATPADLGQLASNPSEAVRIAAVVALRRLGGVKELMGFLADTSTQVMSDAVLGIYDAADTQTFRETPQALEAVARKLDASAPSAVNLRALAANRRLGTREAVARIATFLPVQGDGRLAERILALDLLASWPEAATLDPVDGRYFPVLAFSPKVLEAELEPLIGKLASERQGEIARRVIALSAYIKVTEEGVARGAAAILDDSLAMPLRLAWFQWLQKQQATRADEVAFVTLKSTAGELRLAAAEHLLNRNLKTDDVRANLKEILRGGKNVRELQAALALLKRVPGTGVTLRDLLADLRVGKLAPSIQLDVIEAARSVSSSDKDLAALLADYDGFARAQKPFGEFSVALQGGDPELGRSLFLGHTDAMCSKCHALRQIDQQVGPSLQGVGARLGRAELLESILEPQAKIAPGYGIQTLELIDGTSVTGTQMSESGDAIVIKNSDGTLSTHPKTTIKSATQPVGIMPPVASLLSIREIRDLVAFLASLDASR